MLLGYALVLADLRRPTAARTGRAVTVDDAMLADVGLLTPPALVTGAFPKDPGVAPLRQPLSLDWPSAPGWRPFLCGQPIPPFAPQADAVADGRLCSTVLRTAQSRSRVGCSSPSHRDRAIAPLEHYCGRPGGLVGSARHASENSFIAHSRSTPYPVYGRPDLRCSMKIDHFHGGSFGTPAFGRKITADDKAAAHDVVVIF